ncbi:MAG: NHLP bacteriocin system secretion protein [Bacteroidetes bacterium]|nr:NHLP bacteriocin system secretion protein [Bacteroidota bacterium]
MDKAEKSKPSGSAGNLEDLNRMLKITRPRYWISLAALGLLTVVAVFWGIFGSIPQRIDGLGEIVSGKGLHGIIALYPGGIEQVNIELGEKVKEGEILLHLVQPQLRHQLIELNAELDVLKLQDSLLQTRDTKDYPYKMRFYNLEEERLNRELNQIQDQISFFELKMQQQQDLWDKGLATRENFVNAKNQLSDAKNQHIQTEQMVKSNELDQQSWKYERQYKQEDYLGQIQILKKKIADLQDDYDRQTIIRSPVDGMIIDKSVTSGDFVNAGTRMMVVEDMENEKNHLLDLFIPFNSNAVVEPGMQTMIEPFTVNHNLYGWLMGEVVEVNHFVSNTTSIIDELNNPDLVALIEQQGPTYRVKIRLIADSSTISGFKWSNKAGPPYTINTGTLCRASVVVKQKPPIDYIIPIFKSYFE